MQSLKWKRPKRIRWIVIGLCLSPFLNLLHYANQYQLGFGDVSVLVVNLPNLTVNVNLAPSKDGFETSFGNQDYRSPSTEYPDIGYRSVLSI